ncbi:MAG: ATP-binding protein [Cyanobacteriota bacterium]
MFKKNKVNKFLLIGFFGNFLLIVLLLTISIIEINAIKSSFRSTYESNKYSLYHLDSINTLYSIEVCFSNWHKLTKQHILSDDIESMNTLQKEIEILKKDIRKKINDYKYSTTLDSVSAKIVKQFEEYLYNFAQNNSNVLALSYKGNKDSAIQRSIENTKNNFLPGERRLLQIIESHVKYRIAREKKDLHVYNAGLDNVNITLISITGLGILISIISVILAVLSINAISKNYDELAFKEKELSIQYQELLDKEKLLEERNKQLIQKRKEVEFANRELIIINKSLRELDYMKSNFISTVSHELRTPLTSIKGSLGLILNNVAGKVDSEATTFLEICYRNTNRLIRLITELLDISKIESGKISLNKVEFNLSNTIKDSIEDIGTYAIDKKVKIFVDIEENLNIYADKDRILQILYNVLSNAIKFSSLDENKTGEINVSAYKQNDFFFVKVVDNGIGIPEEKFTIIFEKFTQVDNSSTRNVEGTGLGLTICKLLVEEHYGKIWVESILGQGATFIFTIASKELQLEKEQVISEINY